MIDPQNPNYVYFQAPVQPPEEEAPKKKRGSLFDAMFFVDPARKREDGQDEPWHPYVRRKLRWVNMLIRVLFLLIGAVDILLCIKLDEWTTKYRSNQSPFRSNIQDSAYNDIAFWFVFSFVCAIIAALINFAGYFMSYRLLSIFECRKYIIVMLVQGICFLLEAFNLPNHTVWRWACTITAITLGTVQMILCAIAIAKYKIYDTKLVPVEYWATSRAPVDPDWEMQFRLRTLNDFSELLLVRTGLWNYHRKGVKAMLKLLGILFMLTVWLIAYEMVKVLTSEPRRLTTANILSGPASPAFSGRIQSTYNVLVVVVSGLRYAELTNNAQLKSFVSTLGTNAITIQASASLPTASIPNWATIASGVSPENTGILGDWVSYQTLNVFPFTNIFQFATANNMNNGIAGSTPWIQMLSGSTTPYYRNAIVPRWYGTYDFTNMSALLADQLKTDYTVTALSTPAGFVPLFLTELSNVNVQGDALGYDDAAYTTAINYAVAQLTQLKARVDALNSVMVIVSDHGQDLESGSGGYTVNTQQVPIIIYRPSSNLSTNGPSYWAGLSGACSSPSSVRRTQPYQLVDLAPTLAAILGINIPWQAEGSFIEEALFLVNNADRSGTGSVLMQNFKDLFIQKRHQICQYTATVLWVEEYAACIVRNANTACTGATSLSAAACACSQAVNSLRSYSGTKRSEYIVQVWSGNFVVSMGYCFMFTLLVFAWLHMYSYTDLKAIFKSGKDTEALRACGALPDESAAPPGWTNRKAMLVALLLQLIYWAGCCITFLVAYVIMGFFFKTFDTTAWHQPTLWGAWFGICLITGAVFAILIEWSYKVKMFWAPGPLSAYHGRDNTEQVLNNMMYDMYKLDHVGGPIFDFDHQRSTKVSFWKRLVHWLFDLEPDASPTIYCIKWYMAWLTVFLNTAMIWSCCIFCAIVPMGLSDPFVTQGSINWRYRLMSLLCLGLPQLVVTMWYMAIWAPWNPWTARWDRVFALRVAADCRRVVKELRKMEKKPTKTNEAALAMSYLRERGPQLARAWHALHFPLGQFPHDNKLQYNPDPRPIDPLHTAPFYPEATGAPDQAPAICPIDSSLGVPMPMRSQVADKADFYDIDVYEDSVMLDALNAQ